MSSEVPKTLDELSRSLNRSDLKGRIDQKLKTLLTLYEKKRRRLVQVNTHHELDPSSILFLLMP
jgi:hypothetical protein